MTKPARTQPELTLVVIRCSNIVESLRFYDALGILFVPEQHGSGPQHYSGWLGATVLELYPASEPPSPIRLGIGVADLASAVAAVRVLGDCVVRFDPEKAPDSALLRDPDGNKVELTIHTVSAMPDEAKDIPPAVRVSHFDLVLSPPHHGWVDVSLRLGDFELTCSASTVLNDPLAELLDLAVFARDGHSGFRRVCFWLEPEGYAVDLRHMTESEVMLTVLHDVIFHPPMAAHELRQMYRCMLPRAVTAEGILGAVEAVLASTKETPSESDQAIVGRLRAAYVHLG